jgi:hypoxanthine-guanine phosphoribosyltransferase/DNA-binding Lrp family transcriptional regulator
MKVLTSNKILEYISKNGQASGKELTDYLGNISGRAIRKQLKNLTDKKLLQKIGKPPKVYYSLSTNKNVVDNFSIRQDVIDEINARYLYITPTGESKQGWLGFLAWCEKTKQNPVKTANEYISTINKFDKFKNNGLVNGMPKMKNTFKNVFLDKLYYLDFYSIERFGKTKLGQMLLYAKQSQNAGLINQLINQIRPEIIRVINENTIDGILFIPPTVKREIQFMKELERQLNLGIRALSITKIKTEIIVPQKTLSKLEDRIENARKTIIVDDKKEYKNILFIDDAVGSGATMNETAKQVRRKNLVSGEIIGLAITGSFKGFDIISEV